jgi:type 2 lantibiotic biosynthesis protein LanM
MPPSADTTTPSANALGIPFAELLEPLVGAASQRLTDEAGHALEGVAPSALGDARAALLRRLSWLAAPQLYARLEAMRAAGGGYAAFAARHRGAGWARFLEPLPELERLLALVADQWVTALGELLARLDADRPRLAALLGAEVPPGRLTGLHWPASDLHCGGRGVAILTFEDGRRLVYKPRDVRVELAFGELLHALAHESAQPPMRTPAVLAGDGYGWVEHVVAVACTGPAAAERYYRRAGLLAALFHALGSRDMHHDAVLSCGEHPIVVDAETVLGTEPPRAGRLSAGVLESALLPRWVPVRRGQMAADAQGTEMGALGAGGGVAAGEQWTAIGTDRMAHAVVPWTLPAAADRPHVDGRPVTAADHLDALRASFASTYRVLARWGPDLLAPGGAGHGLAAAQFRVLHRSTSAYHALLYQGRSRACLASTTARDARLRAGLAAAAGTHEPAIEAVELQALRDLDVPVFSVPAASGPTSVTAARLAMLGEADLARQDALLRAALARPWSAPRPDVDGAVAPLDADAALAAAVALGEEIAAAALPAPDGQAGALTWIGATVDAPTGRAMAGPIGAGLYGGGLGVALFLAELAARSGGDGARWRALALAAAAPARSRHGGHRLDLGLADGVGGLVYGLCRLARVTGDRSLLDDAVAWAGEITPERLGQDACGDLLRGGAGAVVGLLTLHAATGDDAYLERAMAAGQELPGRGPGVALALALLARAAGSRDLAGTALAVHRAGGATGIAGWCEGDAGRALTLLAIGEALGGNDTGARLLCIEALTAIDRLATAPLGGPDDSLAQGEAGRVDALASAALCFERPDLAQRARGLAAELLAAGRVEGGLRLIGCGVENRLVPGLLCGTAGVGLTLLRLCDPVGVVALLGDAWAAQPAQQPDHRHLATAAAGRAASPPTLPLDFV